MGPNEEGRRTPPPGAGTRSSPGPQASPGSHAPPAGPTPPVEVRRGTDADAPVSAALHAGQISQGFLSALGPGFLRRLYRRIGRSPESFLLVAASQGATVGFVAGSTNVAGLYRSFLLHDGIPAGLQAAGSLITGWRRVLDTLGHASAGGTGSGRGPELLAIAVDPAWQGHGVGRLLVRSFLDEVSDRGGDAAHVVVGAGNRSAVSLYERAGFVTVQRFELHAGTESLLMQWDRPPGSPVPDDALPS
ncbi:MAG: N-acetyltransferase [Acidimicrobiales bacterium]